MIQPRNPKWLEEVSQAYLEGAFDAEIQKIMGLTADEFDEFITTNPSVKQLVDLGRMHSRAFWYSLGRKGALGEKLNYQFWYAVMKNQFGWADKTENVGQSDIPTQNLSSDEIKARIAPMLAKIIKLAKGPGMTDAEVLKAVSGGLVGGRKSN